MFKNTEKEEIHPKPKLPKALSEDVRAVAANFGQIREAAPAGLRQYLKKARLSAGENNHLIIVLEDEVSAGFVGTEEHKNEIKRIMLRKPAKKWI